MKVVKELKPDEIVLIDGNYFRIKKNWIKFDEYMNRGAYHKYTLTKIIDVNKIKLMKEHIKKYDKLVVEEKSKHNNN